jgi:hypothetical protein
MKYDVSPEAGVAILTLGAVALVIALSSLALDEFWIDEHFVPHVSRWGAGCYWWLLSFIVLLVGARYCASHQDV